MMVPLWHIVCSSTCYGGNREKAAVKHISRKQNLNVENNLFMEFSPGGNKDLKGVAFYTLKDA